VLAASTQLGSAKLTCPYFPLPFSSNVSNKKWLCLDKGSFKKNPSRQSSENKLFDRSFGRRPEKLKIVYRPNMSRKTAKTRTNQATGQLHSTSWGVGFAFPVRSPTSYSVLDRQTNSRPAPQLLSALP